MRKEEMKENALMGYNLQFFAGDESGEKEEGNDDSGEDDDSNEGSGNESGDDSKEKKESKTEKTFTQSQVNKLMAKEKNQGKNAALKELGIDPKDSKLVNMVKSLIESQKSDEQKKLESETAKETANTELEKKVMLAEAKAEVLMLGVKSAYVEDAVTLALAKMDDTTELKDIVAEFKTKYPVWFVEPNEDSVDDKKKIGQKGTGSSIKNGDKSKGNNSEKSMGARLAAQRVASTPKKSFWS